MIRQEYFAGRRKLAFPEASWPLLIAVGLGFAISVAPLLPSALVLAPFLAIVLFIEPLVGIGLMLFAAPWGALENVLIGPRLLDSGQMLFFITAAAWMAHGAVRKRIWLVLPRFLLPLTLFVGVGSLSLLRAPSAMTGLIELFKWIEIGAVALIVADRATDLQRKWPAALSAFGTRHGGWRIILFLILAAAMSQALVGIWQFGMRETGPEHFQILGGRFYRAYGAFEQPNPYGGFMAWMAALAAGAAIGEVIHRLQSRRWGALSVAWITFLFGSSILFLLALVFSWSRGAWMSFAAAIAGMALLLPKRRAVGGALFCMAFFAALIVWQSGLLPVAVADRLAGFTQDLSFGDVRGVDINDANYAVLERLAHWQAAVDMARNNLWSGVGIGNYEAAYGDYALINWPLALGHAHNYYLNILAETGIIGLAAYLVLWAVIVLQTLLVLQRSAWPERGAALGLMAVWIALSVHHLLDKLYVNNLYLYLGALLGILHILSRRSRGRV